MTRRIVRTLAVVAAAVLLTATGVGQVASAAPASAPAIAKQAGLQVAEVAAAAAGLRAEGGYCDAADTSGVTVVVDYGSLGGVDIRCASGLSRGSTGADAMAAAGFGTSGTQHDGPNFVCRINGEPASDPCVDTPSGSAYWSNWNASNGGGWGYSTSGFASSRVKLGGFEGWAFGSGGAPGINPVLPAAPEPEPPAPEPQQPEPQQPEPQQPAPEPAPGPQEPAAPEPEQPAAEQPAAEPAPEAGTPENGGAPDVGTESAGVIDPAVEAAAAAAAAAAQAEAAAQVSAAEVAAASAAAQAAAASAASSSGGASGSASALAEASSATTSAGDSAALSASENTSGSTVWFSVVALLAVASLGAAAVVMARRRRGGADDDQAG